MPFRRLPPSIGDATPAEGATILLKIQPDFLEILRNPLFTNFLPVPKTSFTINLLPVSKNPLFTKTLVHTNHFASTTTPLESTPTTLLVGDAIHRADLLRRELAQPAGPGGGSGSPQAVTGEWAGRPKPRELKGRRSVRQRGLDA